MNRPCLACPRGVQASRRPAGVRRLLATAAALPLAFAPVAPAHAAVHRQGEAVEVTGRVADPEGAPLAGVEVSLLAYHSTPSLRRLERVEAYESHVATLTDAQGDFSLTWSWHDFYDRFWVAAGLKLPGESAEFHELDRVDVSKRMVESGPVVVTLELPHGPELDGYLEFVAALASEDERRVFSQMGQPERVDRLELAQQEEVTWWYFRSGKAYRFEDGRLDVVIPFDPVKSF
jgi:hypothetical protein